MSTKLNFDLDFERGLYMKKANMKKLENIMADFLQYRFRCSLITKTENGEDNPDFIYYQGACAMVDAIGGEWKRFYSGSNSKEDLNNIKFYSHAVWLPDDKQIDEFNIDAWKI